MRVRVIVRLSALAVTVVLSLFLVAVAGAHPAHVYERSLGSAGSGAGQLALSATDVHNGEGIASGVAVNEEAGYVYVADTGNHRVDEFTEEGAFVRAWGWGVDAKEPKKELQTCTTVTGCLAGESGSGPGELESPSFVAVDNSTSSPSRGSVYVADSGDDTVVKFTGEGTLESGWGVEGRLHASPVLAEGAGDLTAGSGRVTNVSVSAGTFEAFQTIVGEGIPAGTKIQEVGPGSLVLRNQVASKSGTTVALAASIVFGRLAGIAVDTSGNLWVYSEDGDGGAHMLEFVQDGSFARDWESPVGVTPVGIAVGPGETLLTDTGSGVVELEDSGHEVGEVERQQAIGGAVTGLAVSPSGGGLYVDSGDEGSPGVEVRHFPTSCEVGWSSCVACAPTVILCSPADSFGAGELTAGQGVAIGRGESLLIADAGAQKVAVFRATVLPNVTTGGVSVLGAGSVMVSGRVNPDGVGLSGCVFEYGTTVSYSVSTACEYEVSPGRFTTDAGEIPAGPGEVTVRARLSGLVAAFYHYRLVAQNAAGAEYGLDATLGASVDSSVVGTVQFTTATVEAQADPHGEDTRCVVQYVDVAAFQTEGFANAASVPCNGQGGDLGSGTADVGVSVGLSGLAEGTAYHFRFVVERDGWATDGTEGVLYTFASSPLGPACGNQRLREANLSLALPDCRAYELVSPADNAEVYISPPPEQAPGIASAEAPIQSSSNGDVVSYVGEAASSGSGPGAGGVGGGEGDEHVATRGTTGWSVRDVQPDGSALATTYQGFADDMSSGVLATGLRTEALAEGLVPECLYERNTDGEGGYTPIVAGADCGEPFFAGASADGSNVLFEASAALTPGAQPASGKGHDNVYDFSDGRLRLVNVLPGATPSADPDASAGALTDEPAIEALGHYLPAADLAGAISADGSRAYWTDLATGIVYVRDNPGEPQSLIDAGKCTVAASACTVQVSAGGATFEGASADGHYVYYLEAAELWRFDSETHSREALAGGSGAGVDGVVGASEDGSVVYFIAEAALTPDAEARLCRAASGNGTSREREEATEEAAGQAPAGRGCNLYVDADGNMRFVAALLPGDDEFAGNSESIPVPKRGVWRPVLGYAAAQLTPSGNELVFMSERRLTAYDNVNDTGQCGGGVHACSEVYVYELQSGRMVCASCDPTGAPPGASDAHGDYTFLPLARASITHTPRSISADGSRVFFDSNQALATGVGAGTEHVYEWEREASDSASGSCGAGSPFDGYGCVYLLSGAGSGGAAYLSEVDENGENAFFVTRAQLTPGDQGEATALYDARINGGFPVPIPQRECESTEACPPASPPPPAFGPVASLTFTGPGEFLPEIIKPPSSPHETTAQIRARHLKAALKACRTKYKGARHRHKRRACEKAARKRYAPPAKKSSGTKR